MIPLGVGSNPIGPTNFNDKKEVLCNIQSR